MNSKDASPTRWKKAEPVLSLYRLLDPEVLADPYPLYHRLRREDPVHWDPFLHAWVITRYADVIKVLRDFSAGRTHSPEKLTAMGLEALNPIAKVMVKQMLFLDPPAHTRIRNLGSGGFHPAAGGSLAVAHPGHYAESAPTRPGKRGYGRDRRSGRAIAVHRDRRDARIAGRRPSPVETVVTGFR